MAMRAALLRAGLRVRAAGRSSGVQRRWGAVGEDTGAEGIGHDIDSADPFQNLGVTRMSTPQEVNANFKKLALRYHPDRPGGNQDHFNKLMKAKEAVLVRLGEKDEDEAAEDVTHHEPEYTYNEETTQWEYKRGRVRVYDDYVDQGVERQRTSVLLLQGMMGMTVAWIVFDNYVEEWLATSVAEDAAVREGRMYAQARRVEYEQEAEKMALTQLKIRRESNPNSRITESHTVEDPFAAMPAKRKGPAVRSTSDYLVLPRDSIVSRIISFIAGFFPRFGQWLRFWLMPDTVDTRVMMA